MEPQAFEMIVKTPLNLDETEQRLREALATENMGVITVVDVAAILNEKLGVDVEPYRILGVCNPQLAFEAMTIWRGFGLIAPCHVALFRGADDGTVVAALNPLAISAVRENIRMLPLAQRASSALERALTTFGPVDMSAG